MLKEGILMQAKDHFLKGIMKRSLTSFVKQVKKMQKEHKYLKMVSWMANTVDEYFEKMSKISNDLSVVCHADFT